MSLTFERKLPIVLTFVFLMLTIVGFFSFQTTVSIQDARKWQNHTREVLVKLDETLTLTLDIEAAMRGFVITGNDTYVEPTGRGTKQINQNIFQLKVLTGEDPTQTRELDNLEALVGQKVAAMQGVVDFRRREGFEASINNVVQQDDRALGDNIRSSIERLKSRELDLLQVREQDFDRNMNRTILILIVSSLAGVAALFIANMLVVLEIGKRRRAEKALIEANEDLEKNIDERTKELQIANLALTDIGHEREYILMSEQAARREAEIANRLRDEFMATVSHELRTPLNSILGWARMMNNGSLDPSQSEKAIRTIIKNSETQNRLIEDLMDVARIISGKLELEVSELKVGDLIIHSIETAKPAADERNISIGLAMQDHARDAVISGDKIRLEQVIGNLLTNAIKFSHENGNVEVEVKTADDLVEIVVSDDGAGISPEFLPNVFERFRQDQATIKKSGGLGLGLAVVRNLTELHGGSVSAVSEGEDKGSKFMVRLPIVRS